MDELQKLPLGIQNFESLRIDGYKYIDKTRLIYRMMSRGRYYFLSRPRRFGKSLLLSTIQAIYEGKRHLFEGLYIDTVEDWDWAVHPILHLDLNTQKYDAPDKLDYVIRSFLQTHEERLGIPFDKDDDNFGPRFERIIERACQQSGQRVVILVDEYDKPMLQAIGNPDLQEAFRATLKGFYGALKSMDRCIRFALLTGVTKFSKVNVFSDLNNLNDISFDEAYASLCGITEEELLRDFPAYIESIAQRNRQTYDEAVAKLCLMYDGYHFHPDAVGIYNPFSLIGAFNKMSYGSYWFETGTPTYLVQLLQQYDYNLEEMSQKEVTADDINCIDSIATNPIPVIYQSGYLTIKGYDAEFCIYHLGFPNKEVEEGFVRFLIPYYTKQSVCARSPFDVRAFVQDVRAGQTDQFITRLRSLFADTPYELIRDLENHYQNVLWLVFKMMGFYVKAEYHTSQGRIDLVLMSQDYCYVMEFKLDGTAEEALQQISDKQYTLPFELTGQQVIRIGMNFSSATRNIERYVIG